LHSIAELEPAMETLMSSSDLLPQHGPGFMLRRLSTADLADFQAYRHDVELGRYQGWLPTPDEQASAFLAEMSAAPFPHPGHWVQIGIAEHGSQRLIGDIGVFLDLDATSAEIGFTLARAAQGRGVATAAVRRMVDLIFKCSTAERVIGITDARNLPSMRLMERVGMRRTETRQAVFRGDACVEHTYTVTRAGT
jgi:[ribosomal protein S5]-alanine N-acetyltransferase